MANPSESSGDAEPTTDPRRLTDVLMDALIYAPIGLTLDGQELAPELARRGRQHAAAARQIGEFAVKAGLRRLDGALASRIADDAEPSAADAIPAMATAGADDDPPLDAAPDTAVADAAESQGGDDDTTPSSAHLAIPDYDLLAASQVVRRLDGLDPDQLEDVRIYEAATRDRRTILHKIARIQG